MVPAGSTIALPLSRRPALSPNSAFAPRAASSASGSRELSLHLLDEALSVRRKRPLLIFFGFRRVSTPLLSFPI